MTQYKVFWSKFDIGEGDSEHLVDIGQVLTEDFLQFISMQSLAHLQEMPWFVALDSEFQELDFSDLLHKQLMDFLFKRSFETIYTQLEEGAVRVFEKGISTPEIMQVFNVLENQFTTMVLQLFPESDEQSVALSTLSKFLRSFQYCVVEKLATLTNRIILQSQQSVQTILDNAGQGFLTFDSSLRVQKEFSQKCNEIFGDLIHEGCDVVSLLVEQEEEQLKFREWIVHSFEDVIDFDVIVSLAPGVLEIQSRFYSLEWSRILQDEQISVMVVLSDTTEQRELQAQVEEEQRYAKMILRVLEYRAEFLEFQGQMERVFRLESVDEIASNLREHFREVHTLKGSAYLFEFKKLGDAIHNYESYLQRVKSENIRDRDSEKALLETVDNSFHGVVKRLRLTLGDLIDWDEIRVKIPASLNKEVLQTLRIRNPELYLKMLPYSYERMKNLFKPYESLIGELADRQEKLIEPLVITGGDFFVDSKKLKPLMSSFVHLFRNAVGHGIEDPEMRCEVGKEPFGKITIEISQLNTTLEIKIHDDGAGIDPQKISKALLEKGLKNETELESMNESELINSIFLPGFSSASELTETSGRGVGMDAVKAEVEKLGGKIEIQTSLGEGTSFHVSIVDPNPIENAKKEVSLRDKQSILILDDDPLAVKVLSIQLEGNKNYRLFQSNQVSEAWKQLQDEKIDLVITDLEMPEMHGFEFMEKAREIHPLCQFIIVTGNSSHEYVKRATNLGVSDYLAKPVRKVDLLSAVESIRDKISRWHATITD